MSDNGIEQRIVTALRRITRAVERYSRRLAEDFGLSSAQLVVLRELVSAGTLPTGELAHRVHFAQATVSEILDRLAALGLVERRRSETDRRRVDCAATPAGFDLVSRSPSILHERFASELARLPEWEQSFLLAALQRTADMMDVDEEAPREHPTRLRDPKLETVVELMAADLRSRQRVDG